MFDREAISEIIPHSEPFLFLDQAGLTEKGAIGEYTITGEETFLAGHFEDRPIFPASLLSEALGQLGVLYLVKSDSAIDLQSIFFIKSEDVNCRRKCIPGDRLEMSVDLKQCREPLIVFSGQITVNGAIALKISSFTLSFSKIKP